jgi:hypothetical protein
MGDAMGGWVRRELVLLFALTAILASHSLASLSEWPTFEEEAKLATVPGAPSARHWAWMRNHTGVQQNGAQRRLAGLVVLSGELQVLSAEGEEYIYVLVVAQGVQFPLDVSKVRDKLPELTSGERACSRRACMHTAVRIPPPPPPPSPRPSRTTPLHLRAPQA